ncbi:MAG: hypothetical protein HYX38_09935 [Rhodospirillales bacterium]|nr:hypothetical protein [Rhodospirillales bacterium]
MLVALGLLPLTFSVRAMAWPLITPEEEGRDRAAPDVTAPPDRPPPPTITLVRPDISQPIRNPVTIEVQFTPGPGSSVNMDSFNATYGRLGINITRRLLDHAVATTDGLSATDVELPSGDHRITLSIADTSGRTASKTLRFSVAR